MRQEKGGETEMDKIPHDTILYDVELGDVIDVVNELISKQGEIIDWINEQKGK